MTCVIGNEVYIQSVSKKVIQLWHVIVRQLLGVYEHNERSC